MGEAARAVVEDVDAAILMARRSHLTIGRDIHGHAEGAFGLELSDLLHLAVREGGEVKDIDAAIECGACEELAILVQRERPLSVRVFLPRRDHALFPPFLSILAAFPDLDFAAEPNAGGYMSVGAGAYVMAANGMDFLECLHEWIRVLVVGGIGMDRLAFGAVDADGRGAGCGQKMRRSRCKREDVGWVRIGDREGLQILLRHGGGGRDGGDVMGRKCRS